MSRRDRFLAFAIAIPGAFCCVAALALFLGRVVRNEMTLSSRGSARDYYLGIGDAYSGGFVTGFFLSFFLMVLAVAIGTFFEQHRAGRQARPTPTPTPDGASK
jgi:glycerol uptake facilitator-like aquaporin